MQFQFSSFGDFLAMGGYGFYVWLAYGISAALFVGLIVQSLRETRQTLRQVKKAQSREVRQKQAHERN